MLYHDLSLNDILKKGSHSKPDDVTGCPVLSEWEVYGRSKRVCGTRVENLDHDSMWRHMQTHHHIGQNARKST
jgi:hypothetical protein